MSPLPWQIRIFASLSLVGLLASAAGQPSSEEKPEMSLPPVAVRGIHVAPDLPSARMRVDIFLNLQGVNQDWNLPNTSITPGRVFQAMRNIAYTSQGLDEALRSGEAPRLRGLPALVLRDRLPAANPFDGSLSWQELPSEGFGRSEIIAGGGATAWDG